MHEISDVHTEGGIAAIIIPNIYSYEFMMYESEKWEIFVHIT